MDLEDGLSESANQNLLSNPDNEYDIPSESNNMNQMQRQE